MFSLFGDAVKNTRTARGKLPVTHDHFVLVLIGRLAYADRRITNKGVAVSPNLEIA
jgi:hypothetical protein